MPAFTSYAHGCPCWVDLSSPDIGSSATFYSAVFGWEAGDMHDDEGHHVYTMFTREGKNAAGLGGMAPGMDGMPATWNTYIAVDDVEAVVAKAVEAGGSIIAPPMQAMDAGRMAVLSDPGGAVFSLWQAVEHIGCDVCNEPGFLSWNELVTRDIDAALAFYPQVFGWEIASQDMGPMGTYHLVQGGEHGGWAGMMAMPPHMPEQVPNHWMVYFAVADLDASIAVVDANGGSIVTEPYEVPGTGRMVPAHDPLGGAFTLMQLAEPA